MRENIPHLDDPPESNYDDDAHVEECDPHMPVPLDGYHGKEQERRIDLMLIEEYHNTHILSFELKNARESVGTLVSHLLVHYRIL